jgi:Kef-type K+ transport system membrane component KefB
LPEKRSFRPNFLSAYAVLVLLPMAALIAIVQLGPRGAGVVSVATPAAPAAGSPNLALLVGQIGLIIALSRVVGAAMERVGQPRVIGEMVAGILLGPSFFGAVAPGAAAWLFPPQGFGMLNALSQLGLVLFMFLVGIEIDLAEVYRNRRLALVVSHASIAAPMTMGVALAVWLYPRMADPSVGFAGFALFIGVAMSITAFPVLARILSERGLLGTPLGSIAIACAAVDDVTGWMVLAYVVAMVRTAHGGTPLWLPIVGLPVFLAVVFGVARPLLRGLAREFEAKESLSNDRKALLLTLLLGSALATETIGLHLLFGAFVLGAAMPKHPGLLRHLVESFESLTVLLLLPLFFAFTGLRTRIGELSGVENWGICLMIIGVAVAGKIGGTGIAARLSGLPWRDALAIGSLMNTRGLMELVVLNIGLEVGLLSPRLFTMMVVMAIATTMMTPPLVARLVPASLVPARVLGSAR